MRSPELLVERLARHRTTLLRQRETLVAAWPATIAERHGAIAAAVATIDELLRGLTQTMITDGTTPVPVRGLLARIEAWNAEAAPLFAALPPVARRDAIH
jgi:hypothetical protein